MDLGEVRMATSVPGDADVATVLLRRGETLAESAEKPTPPPAAAAPEVVPGPRCGGKLVNPGSLGWCMKCGYCKSLEEESAKKVLPTIAPARPSPLGIVECLEVM